MASYIYDLSKGCLELSQPYGFQKTNKYFWRIVNDMYQSFSVDSYGLYPGVKEFRIVFSVMPLCMGLRPDFRRPSSGPYYLKRFEASANPYDGISRWNDSSDGWVYTSDPTCQQTCRSEATRMLAEHLLPFFERTTHSESALEELIQLEALFHDNRLKNLGLSGRPELDPAGPNARLDLYDSTKYYLAIKAGNFEFAQQVLEKLVLNYSEGYSRSLSKYLESHDEPPNEAGIEHLIEHLEKGNFEEIHRLFFEKNPLAARAEEAYVLWDKKTLDSLESELDHARKHDAEYFRNLFEANEESSRNAFEAFVQKGKKSHPSK